jgi:hypothetical protein
MRLTGEDLKKHREVLEFVIAGAHKAAGV